MGVLATSSRRTIQAAFTSLDVNDERAWTRGFGGYTASSGMVVNSASSFQVSCMFHGFRLYGETVGSLPFKVYENLGDGRKQERRDHYLWNVLQRSPNPWQTAQQFRCMMSIWAKAWGRAIAEIRPVRGTGGRGVQLWPIAPDRIDGTEFLPSGKLRFKVRDLDENVRTILQDDLLILDGPGLDPHVPAAMISYAREAIGHWLAVEQYGSRFFSQGARPSMVLEHPDELSPEAARRIEDDVSRSLQGMQNMHRVVVFEEGMKAHPYSFNAQETQLAEMREQLVAEVARWLNLPLQFLFSTHGTATFASAEQFARQAVDYSFKPFATSWEQAVWKSMLQEEDADIYVEHVFDDLLRGHTKERYEAHQIGIGSGFLTRNEVRRKENLNPIEGGDEITPAANLFGESASTDTGGGEAISMRVAEPPPIEAEVYEVPVEAASLSVGDVPRFRLMVEGVAQRLITRERRESEKAMKRDPETISEWADGWYESYSGAVARELQLPPGVADRYVQERKSSLLSRGGDSDDSDWTAAVDDLVALALEGYCSD